jgi:hypothetical protein
MKKTTAARSSNQKIICIVAIFGEDYFPHTMILTATPITIEMLHIYGDSHADFNFRNLTLPNNNHQQPSVTMHRIGRDKIIVGLSPDHLLPLNTFVFQYGEVDCRCHVARQILLGRDADEICTQLVDDYIAIISENITSYRSIVVCAVVPPTAQYDYEVINGPITHEFPFVGTDAERVSYTRRINVLLEKKCLERGFFFFNPYASYSRNDGTLKYELSDNCVHIKDNILLLTEFYSLIGLVESKTEAVSDEKRRTHDGDS